MQKVAKREAVSMSDDALAVQEQEEGRHDRWDVGQMQTAQGKR
jgi:hypothetical protein